MWPFGHTEKPKRYPEQQPDESLLARLYRLETAVQQLQLDNAERQANVLNAMSKLMHAIDSRERKRLEEKPVEDDLQQAIDRESLPGHLPTRARINRAPRRNY